MIGRKSWARRRCGVGGLQVARTLVMGFAAALAVTGGGAAFAQTYTLSTLATFNGSNGATPQTGVVVTSGGTVYGTTSSGGDLGEGGGAGDGSVYTISPTGTLSTVANFEGYNGATPLGLTMDGFGNLYGVTQSGGTNFGGTVFEIDAGTSAINTLFSFTGGATPDSALTITSNGTIYGTTYGGGAYSDGSVFQITAGTHTFSTIASLNGSVSGQNPDGPIAIDSNGDLFGTAKYGGIGSNEGTVFEVKNTGTVASPTYYNGSSTVVSFDYANGELPSGSMVFDSAGNLYGTTEYGGSGSGGTVFEIAKGSSTVTTLVNFAESTNGGTPVGGLTMDSSGNMYGTTYSGGTAPGEYGSVFELAAGTHTFSTLAALTQSGFYDQGGTPNGNVAIDGSGNLYTTTEEGGANNDGTVIELTQNPPPSLTWNGGGTDSNLGTGGNWVGGTAPGATASANLTFDGATHLSPILEQAYTVNSMTFASTAGAFTLVGSGLTIGEGGITQNSNTNLQTISTSLLTLSSAQTWTVANGGLTVNAPLSGSSILTIAGDSAGANVMLSGLSNYTGTISVSSGTLQIQGNGSYNGVLSTSTTSTVYIRGGAVNLAVASGGGTMFITGGTVAVAQTNTDGVVEILGGTVGELETGDPAVADIYGGTFSGSIDNEDPTQSMVNLYGSGFTLTDPVINGSNVDWTLMGELEDGQALDTEYVDPGSNTSSAQGIYFFPGNGSAAAPEPGALAFLLPGAGLVMGMARRRRCAGKH